MRLTIERLRVVLVAGAAALVLVVGGFLFFAHRKAHRLLRDLPERLGADIQKETNGYTYSQAVQGRTVFTIHAAKAVQHRDGKVTLHDVGIVLYGREQNRADRIYGRDFEYDQKEGVVRAAGEVHLDLQAPTPSDPRSRAAYASGESEREEKGENDPELVHARTSGLVYVQELGIASTPEDIEFTYKGISGRAHGAAYNADTGVMTLEHDVRISGVRDDRPALLTATYAEMNKGMGQLVLRGARYVTVGETRGGGDGRTETAAGVLRLAMRADGTLERAEGSDGVALENARGVLRAPRAAVVMNAAGRPASATLSGGVTYASEQPLEDATGRASDGLVHFDNRGRVETATMSGAVDLRMRSRVVASGPWESERELQGARVALRLAERAGGRRELDQVIADGGARLQSSEAARGGHGPEQSDVAGAVITAHFDPGAGQTQLTRLDASGRTMLARRSADGSADRSTGDTLEMHFVPRTEGQSAGPAGIGLHSVKRSRSVELQSAVQRGSVVIEHTGVGRDPQAQTVNGQAREARYDGSDRLRLLGNAMVSQTGSTLRAEEVDLVRSTGEGTARGQVQLIYSQAAGANAHAAGGEAKPVVAGAPRPRQELVHVIADRAEFSRAGDGVATFHGAGEGSGLVRAWQGGSQIEAPTLILRQKQGELSALGGDDARVGAGLAKTGQVHTVLQEAGADRQPGRTAAAAKTPAANARAADVIRITSGRLDYSERTRQADFTGGVLLENGGGSLRSDRAEAFLRSETGRTEPGAMTPTGTGARPEGNVVPATQPFPRGGLDRVVASGHVLLRQPPAREATGEQVIYTAADGMFTLTGTAANEPAVTDASNGTVRGSVIRFHAGDNNVVVSGDPSRGTAGRVRSDIKVKPE